MNEKTKQLTLSATILAIAGVLVMFQIPVPGDLGLALDFSLVALLIGRRYIGFWNTFLVATIYPFFSLFTIGNLPGILFLILQAWVLVLFDLWINKRNFGAFGVFMVIVIVTLWSVILNVFLIGPIWMSGDGYTYLDGWVMWFTVSLIFNPIKLGLVYLISILVWFGLENSFNLEKNEDYINEKIQKLEEQKKKDKSEDND